MLSRFRSLAMLLLVLLAALAAPVPTHAQQADSVTTPSVQLENSTSSTVTVYAVVRGQRIRVASQLNGNERRLLVVRPQYINPTGTLVFFIKPLTGEGYFTDPIQLDQVVGLNVRILDYGPGYTIGVRSAQ